jgi:hypothetical protein
LDPKFLYQEYTIVKWGPLLRSPVRELSYFVPGGLLATFFTWRLFLTPLTYSQLFEEKTLDILSVVGFWLLVVVGSLLALKLAEPIGGFRWLLLETSTIQWASIFLWPVLVVRLVVWYFWASCPEWWFQGTGLCLPRF